MNVEELKILVLQYQLEFRKKMLKRHPSVIHMGVDHDEKYNFFPKEYNYLEKRPKIKIYFTEKYCTNRNVIYSLTVTSVTTDNEGTSFYGYSTQYGHNVYMRADDIFYNEITRIERL